MFNNPGKKLKILAKVFFWVGALACIISAVFVMYTLIDNGREIEGILMGIGIIVFGILFSWISVLSLYAFGTLVESNEKIAHNTTRRSN